MKEWRVFIKRVIDLVLPRGSQLTRLEEMSAAEFIESARPSNRAESSNLKPNIRAIFSYRDPLVKAAIWQIKYRNHTAISRKLAEILYGELLEELSDRSIFENFREPILIPIPLSATRLKTRGYNQIENLMKEMARLDGGRTFRAASDILIKIKETPPQSSLSRASRLKNLEGCFQVRAPEKISGRNIILLDDVATTGATLEEASTTLRRVGARKVIAIVVAH